MNPIICGLRSTSAMLVISRLRKNEQFNSTALEYARTAIQAIESGKTPTEWAPFKGKDDTLAYLHYAVGI